MCTHHRGSQRHSGRRLAARVGVTGVLVACWILATSTRLFGDELRWLEFEPSVVEVSGILAMQVHFGPPNYGEDLLRDKELRSFVLRLSQPINIRGDPSNPAHEEPRENIKEVQINFAAADEPWALRCIGRRVTARGMLFSPIFGGWTVRDVVLRANNVEWCNPAGGHLPSLAVLPGIVHATDPAPASKVKEIIRRRICFEWFWREDARFRGSEAERTWPIEMVIEPDGRFLARVAPRGASFRGTGSPWKFFYVGWMRNGRFYLRETWSQGKAMDVSKFVAPAVVRDVLGFPAYCEPSYEPETPEKQKMMSKLLRSAQRWISAPFDPDSPTAPKRQVEVWVSKFDPGDPYALIVAEGLGELFQVWLQSPEPEEEESYQRSDEYFISMPTLGTFGPYTPGDIPSWRRERKDRVRKYGVKHTIAVDLNGFTRKGGVPVEP